jgi:acyl-CoA thioesterase
MPRGYLSRVMETRAGASAPEAATSYRTATAVERRAPDLFEAQVHPAWWVVRGPHGGYLSAIILRALTERLDDPTRHVRSFTTHFTAAPKEGSLTINTSVDRTGRAMSFLSARVEQNGTTVATALAAFSEPWRGFSFDDAPIPEVPSPENSFPIPKEGTDIPAFLGNFDMYACFGALPFSGHHEAVVGGWYRLSEPQIADAIVMATLLDAWAPAIFPRAEERVVCPTIDLTMHFRSPLPVEGAKADDLYLGRFSSKLSREGFFEEDGELWAPDGTLIAQSRQLALALYPKPR